MKLTFVARLCILMTMLVNTNYSWRVSTLGKPLRDGTPSQVSSFKITPKAAFAKLLSASTRSLQADRNRYHRGGRHVPVMLMADQREPEMSSTLEPIGGASSAAAAVVGDPFGGNGDYVIPWEKLLERSAAHPKSSRTVRLVENGFDTIPELETIRVARQNIALYSMPQEALSFTPNPDLIASDGGQDRRIHCNVEFSTREQEQLRTLQLLAKQRDIRFFPSVAVMATRFLSYSKGDPEAALEKMQATQQWRADYFRDGPIVDSSMDADLERGVIYFTGRDQALRPTLVIRAAKIPQSWYKQDGDSKLTRVLVFCMEYFLRYMVMPGKIENLNIIFDLQGLSMSQLPLKAMGDVFKIMSQHYIVRSTRFYLANMPRMLKTMSGVVKKLLTERQRRKLFFVDDVRDLAREFALHQLDMDLGGTRLTERFFPFPLQPGPFDAGSSAGPRVDAVPQVHEAFTSDGLRGHLWNPSLQGIENVKMECTDEAEGIWRQSGLPTESYDAACEITYFR